MTNKKHLNETGSVVMIVVVVIALFAAGGVGAYVARDGFDISTERDNSSNASTEAEQQQKSDIVQETSGSVALLESALTGDSAVKCAYSSEGNSGVAYVASEDKFRVDYTSPDTRGHVVMNSNTVYVWSDGETEGFKITDAKDSGEDLTKEYDQFNPEKLKEKYKEENLDCENIQFDDNLVEVPSNVDFRSFEDLFKS